MDEIEINTLTKTHLSYLKNLNDNLKNTQLKEYYQFLSNSFVSREICNFEKAKSKKLRINENLIKDDQKNNKSFDVNWNLEYCEYCHLSYWPNNCKIYIIPKFRVSLQSTKIFTKHKLLNFKPKYRSLKEKIIDNVMKRSMKLIYECKRCKSKNLIVKELNRTAPKLFNLNKKAKEKKIQLDIKNSRFIFNNKNKNNTNPTVKDSDKANNLSSSNDSIVVRDRRLKTLQAKLKQSELQQEKTKNEKKVSFGNLADFLQKLS